MTTNAKFLPITLGLGALLDFYIKEELVKESDTLTYRISKDDKIVNKWLNSDNPEDIFNGYMSVALAAYLYNRWYYAEGIITDNVRYKNIFSGISRLLNKCTNIKNYSICEPCSELPRDVQFTNRGIFIYLNNGRNRVFLKNRVIDYIKDRYSTDSSYNAIMILYLKSFVSFDINVRDLNP